MNKKFYTILTCLLFSSIALAAKPGEPAPTCLSTKLHDGHALDINRFKGKVVYIDFWASWCPPCKMSFPSLNKLHTELNSQGLEIVAINLDEDKNDALEFLEHNAVDFPIAYDGEGACPGNFDVLAMPSSYIIDKQGIVREVHLGFDEDSIDKIRTTILALLAE